MLCKQVSFAILTGLFYPLRISPGRILQGFSVSTGLFYKVYRSLLTLPHTAGGFHYAPAPREASHDGEGGDAKPEMPDGNQDGGHFTQVPESVRVCAFCSVSPSPPFSPPSSSLLLLLPLLTLFPRTRAHVAHARTRTNAHRHVWSDHVRLPLRAVHTHRGWSAQISVLPSSPGEEDASPSLP